MMNVRNKISGREICVSLHEVSMPLAPFDFAWKNICIKSENNEKSESLFLRKFISNFREI